MQPEKVRRKKDNNKKINKRKSDNTKRKKFENFESVGNNDNEINDKERTIYVYIT